MDKTLVVVYSYTSTSRRLTQLLCAQLGWASGEIVEVNMRAGPAGTLRCLVDSLLRRQPRIRYVGPDPKEFDTVVLISPIWAYRLAGPMRSFVVDRRSDLKQVVVLSVMASAGAHNAVAEIGHLLGRSPLLTAAFTSREIEDGSCAERLREFGRTVQGTGINGAPLRPAEWSSHAT